MLGLFARHNLILSMRSESMSNYLVMVAGTSEHTASGNGLDWLWHQRLHDADDETGKVAIGTTTCVR